MTHKNLSVFMHPRVFWTGRFNGVSRYVCELTEELIKLGINVSIPLKDTKNEYLLNSSFYEKTAKETTPAGPVIQLVRKILSYTNLREKAKRAELRYQALNYIKKRNFDLVHPTHNNATEILPYIKNKPLVITVHDMTHELFPTSFAASDPSSNRKRQFVNQADRIIAISECTKKDLVNLFNVNPDKIDVIYHGNSLTLPENCDEINLNLPGKYILFVGKRAGYKNFKRFAQAYSIIAKTDESIHLICAGGGAFTDDEKCMLKDLGILERTRQMGVSDEHLAAIYNRALCFVYPSEYEGFGLPILEAYECKCPVLCARASCFPEIADKGALYFNPQDSEEMASLIMNVINSTKLREELIIKGALRLKDFSWKKTAEQTLNTYLKALLTFKS